MTGIDTLRVIASGPIPHDPAEMLGSAEMEELLADLRRFADFVLVDTAPVLVVSDALSIAPKTDGVILMVDAGVDDAGRRQGDQGAAGAGRREHRGRRIQQLRSSRAKMYYGSYKYHYYSSYQYQDKPEP